MPFVLPTTETLDLLFTVTATTAPYGDRLVFNNLAFGHSHELVPAAGHGHRHRARHHARAAADDPEGHRELDQPELGARPPLPAGFDDAWENADAGDQLTFAITLENQGSKEAVEVRLSDRWSQNGVAAQGYSSCAIDSVDRRRGCTHSPSPAISSPASWRSPTRCPPTATGRSSRTSRRWSPSPAPSIPPSPPDRRSTTRRCSPTTPPSPGRRTSPPTPSRSPGRPA